MSVDTSLSLPPGHLGVPPVGETIAFLRDNDFAKKRHQQYGSIFKTHILGRPTVVLAGAEANQFLLAGGMEHFSWEAGWPQNFKVLLGRSLFVQDGAMPSACSSTAGMKPSL